MSKSQSPSILHAKGCRGSHTLNKVQANFKSALQHKQQFSDPSVIRWRINGSLTMGDIIYTLLLCDFEMVWSLWNTKRVKKKKKMCRTSIGLHLSHLLSAAPRCWSLVAGTALLALGITQPEVWRLWTNNTHLRFSQRQSRRTQGE